MDEHGAMEMKGQCDDSRKRKRPESGVETHERVGECVCECKAVQAEAHGLYYGTLFTMCRVFSWLPEPSNYRDTIRERINKLREENPKYDKFFGSVFRGIAKILWRLNNKEFFRPLGSCSRANDAYRKQFKGFVTDLFKIQPELKTVEDTCFAICNGRVNMDKYPLLKWEKEIADCVQAYFIFGTYCPDVDKVVERVSICECRNVPPTTFARADLKVAEQIIAEVRPFTVDQRTHLLVQLLFYDRDNSLDALILDAFQEMKIVYWYEELNRQELRKIFPSRQNYLSRWEADIDSRIRRIFTNIMYSICQKLSFLSNRALRALDHNWFEVPFSSNVLRLMQVTDLRRRSEDQHFISKKHIVWAFVRWTSILDFLPEFSSLSNACGEKCAKHPPYDVYVYSCKFAKLHGAEYVELKHLALAVKYASSIDQNLGVVETLALLEFSAFTEKFIEDFDRGIGWKCLEVCTCDENVGGSLHMFDMWEDDREPEVSVKEITEKLVKEEWSIDDALADLGV